VAVYERTYKRYTGEITPYSSRFLILPRYIFKDVFQSRWLLVFFVLCFVYPLLCSVAVYLGHNAKFLEAFPNFEIPDFIRMSPLFLENFLHFQGFMAFCLALFVGPGLVSKDLSNNGLPLYLSRPFTRAEYVVGKMSVIGILLSAITWVPAFFLVAMHANYEGAGWLGQNLRLVFATFVGSLCLIVALGLLGLAVSAWVKWRPVAGFFMFFVVLTGDFFGVLMFNSLFRTDYGSLVSLRALVSEIWSYLLGTNTDDNLPLFLVLLFFGGFLGLCLLMLHRKIRAYEVVK
jgi:ABC-2 type transport system permease protein